LYVVELVVVPGCLTPPSFLYILYVVELVVVPGCLTPPSFLYILYVVELALVLNMHDLFVTGK
jgi:hypothetical protein